MKEGIRESVVDNIDESSWCSCDWREQVTGSRQFRVALNASLVVSYRQDKVDQWIKWRRTGSIARFRNQGIGEYQKKKEN